MDVVLASALSAFARTFVVSVASAASALDFSLVTAVVLAEILIEFRISAASALDFSVAMDVVLASALSAFASAK